MASRLYRVFSHVAGVAPDEPGGALFIPPQGAGRIDNPSRYSVLYVSTEPDAAVAEALGPLPAYLWTAAVLRGHPALPGSVRALATFEIATLSDFCNLDDPRQLIVHGLRPSKVITRDYNVTQAWALRLYLRKRTPRWKGVRWWSFYEGTWSSIGIWRRDQLHLVDVATLKLVSPTVLNAARTIGRQVMP